MNTKSIRIDYPKLGSISERLRWARTTLNNLTQEELARKAGCKRDVIYSVEKGRTTLTRHILEIAVALGVSPSWLQFGKDAIDDLSAEAIEHAIKFDRLSAEGKRLGDAMIDALEKSHPADDEGTSA